MRELCIWEHLPLPSFQILPFPFLFIQQTVCWAGSRDTTVNKTKLRQEHDDATCPLTCSLTGSVPTAQEGLNEVTSSEGQFGQQICILLINVVEQRRARQGLYHSSVAVGTPCLGKQCQDKPTAPFGPGFLGELESQLLFKQCEREGAFGFFFFHLLNKNITVGSSWNAAGISVCSHLDVTGLTKGSKGRFSLFSWKGKGWDGN